MKINDFFFFRFVANPKFLYILERSKKSEKVFRNIEKIVIKKGDKGTYK